MATPTTLLWPRDPHTEAKHQMLSRYLQAWFPIIASRFVDTGLTYAEGFAGPGEYEDGAEGSPLIAIRQALRGEVQQHRAPLRMVCIENHPARLAHLNNLVTDRFPTLRTCIDFRAILGDCEDRLLPELDHAGAFNGPIFANLDGWGVDTPYDIVRRIGQCRSSEVLVTFGSQFFIRFGSVEENTTGETVFGNSRWREVINLPTPDAKRRFLVDEYLRSLNAAGFPYTLTFELLDEGGHSLLLVFGTGSDRGVEKMKDAMWKVDPIHGQRFRDPRDINQLVLDIQEPDFGSLRRQILGLVSEQPRTKAEIQTHVLLHTIYKKVHATKQVQQLVEAGQLVQSPGRRHEDIVVSLPAQPSLF